MFKCTSRLMLTSLVLGMAACNSPGVESSTSTAITLGDPTSPAVSCTAACNTTLLNLTKDFNVFVFKDYSAPSSDAEGRIVAGRDINIDHYSVGTSLTPDASRYDVIAGRNVSFGNGDVPNGGIAYGSSYTGNATSLSPAVHASPLSFTAAQVQIQGISDSISHITSNQTANISYTGDRAFIDLNANLVQNVYSISATDLANAHTFTIEGSASASVIVNVLGANASLNSFSMSYSGGITRDHILFNFVNATSLQLGQISIEGTILAPLADVTFPSGVLYGQLIANSMSGAGQFNYDSFKGCLPVVSSLNYFKDSFTDSTDGSSLGGTSYEIYGTAIKQVGDYIIVGVNANFALGGEVASGTQISWGDFIFNFAGDQSTYNSATPATTYAVKFRNGSASDAINASLGLYSNVTAQGVENSHHGWWSWNAYSSYVLGHGALNPLLAGKPNSYFDDAMLVPNSIGSGNFVSSTGFQMLTPSDLTALGIDFPSGLSTSASHLGSVTFGFSFKRTPAMVGNFTAHLSMECANDVIAFPGTLEASCH